MPSPLLASEQSTQPLAFAELFATRAPSGHKGTFGSVGILGGAPGMTGAAILAGRAALKLGAGKVLIALAQQPLPVAYDPPFPELMLREADELLAQPELVTAWAAGCGLGRAPQALAWLQKLMIVRETRPLVLDADALNALASHAVQKNWGPGEVVLTPHPQEAARLLQVDTKAIEADRLSAAQQLAKTYQAWIVLKGPQTLICAPDLSWQVNETGNVGLASGGTGDVLSGILVSLLAQGMPVQVAVPAAVWLHGAAADHLVAHGCGPVGLTAGELADAARAIRNRDVIR
jgi:hydroxyethylthiazole kinase-like uncharacterized protein yjeF